MEKEGAIFIVYKFSCNAHSGLDFISSLVSTIFCYSLCSVFLIDHAWTYEVNYAREQLKTIPGLADRMALLMGLASTGNATL